MDDYSPAKNLMTMCFTYYYYGRALSSHPCLLSRNLSELFASVGAKKHNGNRKHAFADRWRHDHSSTLWRVSQQFLLLLSGLCVGAFCKQ